MPSDGVFKKMNTKSTLVKLMINQKIEFQGNTFQVIGVVEDFSMLAMGGAHSVWAPYTFNKFSSIFEEDIYNAIDLLTCVEERSVIGGPSSSSVKIQIEILEKFIKTNKENLSCLK